MKGGLATTLRDTVVSRQDIRRLVGDIYLNRICLGFIGALWVFTTVFVPGDRVEVMSLPLRAVYNAAGMFFYCLTGYVGLPVIIRAALVRNIPFAWANVLFYSALAGIETIVFLAIFPESSGTQALFYWLTTTVMIVISVVLVAYHFEEHLRRRLSKHPDLLPIWRPQRLPQSRLEMMLPPESRAPVRRIEAQNQYVRVITETGETLLRMSLTEAESLLPAGNGLRIHRSIWMRTADMDELVFREGNPRLRDAERKEFPVSRKKVGELRRILERRSAPARKADREIDSFA